MLVVGIATSRSGTAPPPGKTDDSENFVVTDRSAGKEPAAIVHAWLRLEARQLQTKLFCSLQGRCAPEGGVQARAGASGILRGCCIIKINIFQQEIKILQ